MTASIPASAIVNVLPNVISAGGTGLDLVGLILTNGGRVPVGSVLPFSNPNDVASYFGPLSTEASLANTYFAGYDNSSIKPAKLYFAAYEVSAVGAFLRGGDVSGLSLTALQALTGTLAITVNGSVKTSATINLSAATSFSNAATIIQAAFTSPGFTVSYDSVSGAFLFTDSTTGAASTLSYAATGSLATSLALTQAAGAALSQGSDAMVPATAMAAIVAVTQDWVSFTTSYKPDDTNKLLFAAWANSKADRFLYVGWDDNTAATTANDTTSFGAQATAAAYGAVVPIYDPNNGANVAAFLMGSIASLNFIQVNGRATMAFRTGTILAGVTNQTIGDNLIANGYNFVGSYATANDDFTFFYPGQLCGPFAWIDSWVCQVWMNNALQLALMELLTTVGQIPYNADGYALIEAAMADPVQQALNFGAIRAGIALSSQQAAEINNAAGGKIDDVVSQRGWFIKVSDPGSVARGERRSPLIFLWYTDGESVQQIDLSSVLIQ